MSQVENRSPKKPRAVVFGLTANHTGAVAPVLMDLRRLSPGIADVCVILHDGKLTDRDQKLLHSIFPCRFETYRLPIKDTAEFNQGTLRRFTYMVFSKFECLRLLSEYSAVLWLDYDIVIQQDISDLMNAGPSQAKFLPSLARVRNQLHEHVLLEEPITEYDLDADGISCGTFVLFDTLAEHQKMHAFCYETTARYAKHLYLPEQAIFDFLIQQFGIRYDIIEHRTHVPHPSDAHACDARIIHAYGGKKFWNGIHNSQWQANYAKWRQMGGSAIVTAPFWTRLRRKVRAWFK